MRTSYNVKRSANRRGIYVSGAQEAEELYERSLPIRLGDLPAQLDGYVLVHTARQVLLSSRQVHRSREHRRAMLSLLMTRNTGLFI